jgi:hypothetical protein
MPKRFMNCLIAIVQLANEFASVNPVMLPKSSAQRVMRMWSDAVIPGA